MYQNIWYSVFWNKREISWLYRKSVSLYFLHLSFKVHQTMKESSHILKVILEYLCSKLSAALSATAALSSAANLQVCWFLDICRICRFVWGDGLMWLWHGIKDGCYNWELVQDQPLHSSQWRVQHAKCLRITWWDGDA